MAYRFTIYAHAETADESIAAIKKQAEALKAAMAVLPVKLYTGFIANVRTYKGDEYEKPRSYFDLYLSKDTKSITWEGVFKVVNDTLHANGASAPCYHHVSDW